MMFLGGDVSSDTPKLAPLKLATPKAAALKRLQDVFLEGRQINALYICTHEELQTAKQRKLDWLGKVNEVLTSVASGSAAADYFDSVSINVLRDRDPIESHSELFHNELNQRLERLRIVRRALEEIPEIAVEAAVEAASAEPAARPASPLPKPKVDDKPQLAVPSPVENAGVSSPALSSISDEDDATPMNIADASEATARVRSGPIQPMRRAQVVKIMLVLCTRNGTARQALCRFAAQMDLNFEIIDYNPEEPHAIIEQMYRHRDAKFAVVYWADPSGKEMPGSAHPERYVGFSLGFVLGRLGRARVFIIGSNNAAPLPGFSRILVAQLDLGGGWQIQLARRMKAAGIDIDLNRLA
jgi:predicted nucleotide-binding protein